MIGAMDNGVAIDDSESRNMHRRKLLRLAKKYPLYSTTPLTKGQEQK